MAIAASPAIAQQAGTTDPEVSVERPGAPIQQQAEAEAGKNVGGLEEIVVTARRSAERAQDVPIAITTVTANDLTKLSVRDVIEIQKMTPGLYMNSQNSSGRVKITIRGQSEADNRLTTDPSVGVYIDGVNYARTYGLRSAFVDLAQVEVLKGPQGTLFGKNTTGGAINITTQHPKYEAGGYVDMLYGSYNNMQAVAVLNVPLVTDKLAMRAVGQVVSRDGYGTQGDGRDIGDDRVVNGRLLLRADPADNVRILLSGDYVRQRNNGTNVILTYDAMLANGNIAGGALGEVAYELGLDPASAADRLVAYGVWRSYFDDYQGKDGLHQSGYARDPRGIYDNVDHWGTSADIAVDIGDVTVKSITSYRDLDRNYVQDLDGTPFLILPTNLGTEAINFSQEIQVSAIDGEGIDWQVGGYYNRESGTEFSASEPSANVGRGQSSIAETYSLNKSLAGYGQVVVNFSERFRMTGGLRYTDDYRGIDSRSRRDPTLSIADNPAATGVCRQLAVAAGGPVYPNCTYKTDVSFQELTWLISADFKPTPDTLIYGSVNKGYRAGGFTAQGIAGPYATLAALEAAATPFEPEKVIAYETGFKVDVLGRKLRVNGAAYYQDYTNIQQQIRDLIQGQPVTLIRNAAAATLWGGELEIIAAPTPTTDLNFGLAYLNANYDEYIARDSSGNEIDLSGQPFPAPEWTFNIGGTQSLALDDGELRLSVNYSWADDVAFRTDATDLATVSQKAFGLLDARLTWVIDSQDLEVSVFGKNLTNERYRQAATNLESLGYNIAFPGDPRVFGIQARKNF
ncbi:iron complex outermembrane receptor protein [Croceicoccus sp. BE223]|nr:iron complex outermembrane receptor protein [Croceicoccus sp. BE223]